MAATESGAAKERSLWPAVQMDLFAINVHGPGNTFAARADYRQDNQFVAVSSGEYIYSPG
jgi:hypothetical protein